MMRVLFKGLGLFVAVTCVVWLAVLWQWQASRRDMSTDDIVLYLVVLPVALFALLLLGRWAFAGASARADRRAVAPAPAEAAAAEPATTPDAAAHATCQLLAASLRCAAGTSARDLLQAARDGQPRPGLDRRLRRADGLPAITARVADADEHADESLVAASSALALQRPEFAGREAGERLQRALCLLRPVLAEAVSALSPWAVHLGGMADSSASEISGHGTAGADTLAQVAAHDAQRRAPLAPEPPTVRVLVAWPEATDDFGHALAHHWLADTLREMGEGIVDPARWRIQAQPAGSGPELLIEADRLLQVQRSQGRGDLLLLAACHSDLDATQVLRLDDAQALFGTTTPRGRIPGEAAAALLLADASWPDSPERDDPVPHLNRPAVGQRSKSIDAPGRTSSELVVQLLQHALAAARLPAVDVAALASDADQHSPRGPELFGATLAELPHLDAAEDLRLAGPVTGHLGPCGALVSIAMAAQQALDSAQPCLALSVSHATWRAALLARPGPVTPPVSRPTPSPA